MSNNKEKHIIDQMFDDIDDPIIDNCNTIGFLESLIWNSTFDVSTQKKLLEKIEKLRESEIGTFIAELKANQNIRDPKHQFEQMVKMGMFNE
jgi:hypothetical protein